MVIAGGDADHRRMTTQQPAATRVLRRRGDDRVLGGVASGIADYFNVDPLLIRIGFVGLMVFNGLGLLLYIGAWLFIPADTDGQSVIQRALGRGGIGGVLLAALFIIVAAGFVFGVLGEVGGRTGAVEIAVIALIGIAIGAVLVRRRDPEIAPAVATSSTEATQPMTTPEPVAVRRPSAPPSPLGWYVLGAMLVGIGLMALWIAITGAVIEPARYFGLALAILGLGLIVGAWFGHARLLIVLGLLILPFAFAATLIRVPIEGGFGSHIVSPGTPDELSDEYRLVGGQIVLDLSRIEDTGEPTALTASVATGEILVLVPEDAALDLDLAVGGGQLSVFGLTVEGTNLEDQRTVDGDGPRIVLDLEAGLGQVQVETRRLETR
jgi:phage shock protein PspC (stress-responsive transcriptional regulator)